MLACRAMLTVRLWHNPDCRHSVRALAKLQEVGVQVELYPYLEQPPTAEQLAAIAEHIEGPLSDLIERDHAGAAPLLAEGVTTEEILASLGADPTLIRTPIAECGERVQIGRPAILMLGVLRPSDTIPHLSEILQYAAPGESR